MTELFLSWLSSLHPLSLKLVLKNLLMFSMCKLLRESICWSNSLFLIFWKCKVLIRPWLMIGIKFPFQSYFQSYSKNILLILISEKRSSTSPCGLVLHEGFSLNSLVLFFFGDGGGMVFDFLFSVLVFSFHLFFICSFIFSFFLSSFGFLSVVLVSLQLNFLTNVSADGEELSFYLVFCTSSFLRVIIHKL